MDPKLTDPVYIPHDRFMKSADTSGTHTDRDCQERQRVTKDWRDLAELLQQSAN